MTTFNTSSVEQRPRLGIVVLILDAHEGGSS